MGDGEGAKKRRCGGMEACHLYTAVSFILFKSPPLPSPPTSLSHPLASPLLLLQRRCVPPSPRPLQALKGKLCSAARLLLLQSCSEQVAWLGTTVNHEQWHDNRIKTKDFGHDVRVVAPVEMFILLLWVIHNK